MAYATQAQMIVRFGEQELIQLTDRAQPHTNVIDTAVLAAAITRADDLVDSYLRTRYTVPLLSVPPTIANAAENIARRYLYDDGAPEGVLTLYGEALAYLAALQKGQAKLDDTATAPSAGEGTVGTAEFTTSRRDFACEY